MPNKYSKKQLYAKILKLQSEASLQLKNNPDVDKFIDETDIFDEWENILPEKEFPIFVITILNNIKSKTVISSIIESISHNNGEKIFNKSEPDTSEKGSDDHPFC